MTGPSQWVVDDPHLDWSSLPPEIKRERILCAAGQVFSSSGLAAPMPAVAVAAGVGVGSVYRQFPSKQELIAALVIRRFEQIADASSAAYREPEGRRWEALTEMLWRLVEQLQADDFLGDALITVGDHAAVTVARMRAQNALERLLTAGKAEGKVRPDASADDLRLLFAATRAAKRVDPKSWRRMLTLLIDGLTAQR